MSARAANDFRVAPLGTKRPDPLQHPGLIQVGADPYPHQVVPDGLRMFVRRHLARHYGHISSAAMIAAARFALVAGLPGHGKTSGIITTVLEAGCDILLIGASELSGETAGAGREALAAHETAAVEITRATRRPLAVLIDDFDLSIAGMRQGVEYNVDSQLLICDLQFIADRRERWATVTGDTIPLFFTVNECSVLRESLVRAGRADFYSHILAFDEICTIVARLFGLDDREQVRAIVAAHREEPIAFYVALKTALLNEAIDREIGGDGPIDFAGLGRAKLKPKLTIERVLEKARDLEVNRGKSFLKKGDH